jgi:hypothetical protein
MQDVPSRTCKINCFYSNKNNYITYSAIASYIWMDNVKKPKHIVHGLSSDRDQWRADVKRVTNLRVRPAAHF